MKIVPMWLVARAQRQFPTYCEEALREIVHHAEVYHPPFEGWSNAEHHTIDRCLREGKATAIARGAIIHTEGGPT